jgi:hypothetical protein
MYPAVPDIDFVRTFAFTRTVHAASEQSDRLITRLQHLLVRGSIRLHHAPAPLVRALDPGVRCLRQSRRLEGFEPLKAVGGVTPVLNADLRGQKPMRRFRSPQGPARRRKLHRKRLIGFCSPTLAEQIGSSAFISVSQRFKIRSCQTL